MTVHCANSSRWFVHVSNYRHSDIKCFFRGDSDPVVEYKGVRINLWDYENNLEIWYDEEKQYMDAEHIEYEEKNAFDAMRDIFPDSVYDAFDCMMENYWHSVKRDSKSTKQNKREQTMNTLEREAMMLNKLLPDMTKHIENNQELVVNKELDTHSCSIMSLSQTIRDWQVIRSYDVEYTCCDPFDVYATDEECAAMEQEEETHGYYDETYTKLIDRLQCDGIDPYHVYEVGECVQYWFHIPTGQMVMLGRVYDDDPSLCNFEAEWEPIQLNGISKSSRHAKFKDTFYGNFGEGHYKDISIHPQLLKRGYKGINAWDWAYGCGEEENQTAEAIVFNALNQERGFIDFIQDVINGGEWERKLKQFGMDAIIQNKRYKGSDDAFYTAMKIVNRKKYGITDWSLYLDYLYALETLRKDLHNPFYVCPENLNYMHDKYTAQLTKVQDLLEVEQKEPAYQKLVGKFIGVGSENEQLMMFVCPSVYEMKMEGKFMHHCVYGMGYYKKADTLIMLVRTKVGGIRLATAEINIKKYSIEQIRGKFNQRPELNGVDYYDMIHDMIVNEVFPQIRAIKKSNKKTIKLTTEQPMVMPMAA